MRQTWLRRGQDRSLILVYSGWADWVFAGRRDRMFTAQSMRSVWAGRQVSWLETGHNPFPIWQDWEEIFA